MEQYFLNCHSEESIRTRYKSLAVKMHPDKNLLDIDANKNFQDMIAQRDLAIKKIYSNLSAEEMEVAFRNFTSGLEKILTTNPIKMATQFNSEWDRLHPGKEPTIGEWFIFIKNLVFKGHKKRNDAQLGNQNNNTGPEDQGKLHQ